MDELLVEIRGGVGILRLNRPAVLNAVSLALLRALSDRLEEWAERPEISAVVITGGEKVFAAGADIKEMAGAGVAEMLSQDRLGPWQRLRRFPKPLIAAVAGYALGGGCELALACDLIVASDDAVFGQPEIALGVMPGAGGTQRLTRALGRYRAMEICLAGRRFSAQEGQQWGLICRVVPAGLLLEEALRLAQEIAAKAPLAVRLIKEAIQAAEDTPLEAGLTFERRNFYLLFGTQDQKEGMKAFLEKRKATFTGR